MTKNNKSTTIVLLFFINMLLLAKDVDNAKIVLEQYETLVQNHLSDTSLDYGIWKVSLNRQK